MANPNPTPRPENLKKGNTVNVGRKKAEVRLKLLGGAETAAEYIQKVARGEKVVPVPPAGLKSKNKPQKRYPTPDEMKWAMEQCLRYGLGTSDSKRITVKDLSDDQIRALLEEDDEEE